MNATSKARRFVLLLMVAAFTLTVPAGVRVEEFGLCDIHNVNPNFWPNSPEGGEVQGQCMCTTQTCEEYVSTGGYEAGFAAALQSYCETYYCGLNWVDGALDSMYGVCHPLPIEGPCWW